jgi:hypothetical protein
MQGLDCKTLAYDSDSDYAVFFFSLLKELTGFLQNLQDWFM